MAELKTLAQTDPEFLSYLRGTFSRTHRALPVKSLNVSTPLETVTFEIVPVADIKTPSFFKLWGEVFRFRNFIYVLFPLYLILTKNAFDEVEFDPILAALSGLGALFLTLGAFLLNDYYDHIKGVDRIHPESGSQAIQKGWVTAAATKSWALTYLCFGFLLGAPSLWVFPELLPVVSVPALVAFLAWISPRLGLKYKRGAEIVVFLLFGPFLTVGYQMSIGAGFDLEAVWIGCLTGWHFVFLVQLKNFESLMVNSQVGFENTMSFLGFERGRRVLELWWFSFIAFMAVYQWIYHSKEWFLGFVILPVIFSLGFLISLRKLKSSVGSRVAHVVRLGRTGALLTLILWTLQTFFYWLVIETLS